MMASPLAMGWRTIRPTTEDGALRAAGRLGQFLRVLAVAGGGLVTAIDDPVDEADHTGAAGQIPEGDWNQITDET